MAIVFQGERGAFGELAAVEYFGTGVRTFPVPEFRDIFETVAAGKASHGLIPIENSMSGSIHQNYDLLLENNLFIVGEVLLRVSHFLIANVGTPRKNVRRIFSHPQALAQCKKFLARLGDVEQIPVSNTALAVKQIKEKRLKDAAAIASMQAAIDYDMSVLARAIEDNRLNTTRFLVLGRKPNRKVPPGNKSKTSIVFSTKETPGALFKCLSVFALRDINLLKIESRPMLSGAFQYYFYLDFEGSAGEEAPRNALNHLREITTYYRLLGSYPVGNLAHPEYRKR